MAVYLACTQLLAYKQISVTVSAKKSEIKKKLWQCPPERVNEYKKVVYPKKYFQKNDFKYEIFNHLYFGSNFVFWGTALGHFSHCFFSIFQHRPAMSRNLKRELREMMMMVNLMAIMMMMVMLKLMILIMVIMITRM